MDPEKRIRREIANSNERRRMQSINTGFNSLRTMLPKHDGEKLSKAAILQHTAEYIVGLEEDKTRLLAQQSQLKRLISSVASGQQDIHDLQEHHLVKKIKTDHPTAESSDSADEGIHCNASPIDTLDNLEELKAELIEARKALDRERKLRMSLEEQVKSLETQLYPERVKEIAQQVQVKLRKQNSESMGSIDDSENENEMAVAHLVDDDVIAETIELETCPDSPQPTTIVIQGADGQTFTANPIQLRTTASGNVIRLEAAPKTTTAGGRKHGKNASNQPAAIALPIEVPFISSGGSSSGNNTVTVQIIAPDVAGGDASSTSRHNLETIVEAIRHLEGDHMFKDEGEGAIPIEEEVVATEEVSTDEVPTIAIKAEPTTSTKTIITRREGATTRRSNIIRATAVPTSSSSSSRPGVIVAKVNN